MLFTAKQVMTTGVVCVERDTRIEEVVELFEQHRVSGLPVVDRQQRLLGVITEYDLLRSITALKIRTSSSKSFNKVRRKGTASLP